jgi:hypothetical protein
MNAHRYTLTVPTHDNDGASLLALHDDVRGRLMDAFGGFTVTAGRGEWHTGADVAVDAVRVYTVDVDGGTHGERGWTAFARLAEYVARKARQDAVYLTRQPVETWLITAPEPEAPTVRYRRWG